jgi:archaellin
LFFDGISEQLFDEIPKSSLVRSQVLLNIDKFEIGQSYVTAKIQNRYAENVTINIQGGRPGIELQDSLFKIKNPENQDSLQYAYITTKLIQSGKIFVRKLPVVGIRDWLLIYEDTLVELSVKDAYDELEIIVV